MKKIIPFCLFLFLFSTVALGITVEHNRTWHEIIHRYDYVNITNCGELQNMTNNLSGHYELGNDIDCVGQPWTPVGYLSNPFQGRFEGNGFKISNINVTTTSSYAGFFGLLGRAQVSRVELDNVFINQSGSCALIQKSHWLTSHVHVPKCTAHRAGGLFGASDGANVSQVLVDGYVEGLFQVGMLGGRTTKSDDINNIITHGIVEDYTHHMYIKVDPLIGASAYINGDSRGQIIGALGWIIIDYDYKWWQGDGTLHYAFSDVTYPNITEENRTEKLYSDAPFGNFGFSPEVTPQIDLESTTSFSHLLNGTDITYFRDFCNRIKYYYTNPSCVNPIFFTKCYNGCYPMSNTTNMSVFKGDVSARQVQIPDTTWVDQGWRFHNFSRVCTKFVLNYTAIWYGVVSDTSRLTLSAYDYSCDLLLPPNCSDNVQNGGETDIDYGNSRCGFCVTNASLSADDWVWLSIPDKLEPFDFESCEIYEGGFIGMAFFLLMLFLLFLLLLILLIIIVLLFYFFVLRGISRAVGEAIGGEKQSQKKRNV